MAKTQQKETMSEEEKNKQIYDMVDDLVKKSHVALDQMANFTQEQVDKICEAIATAGEQNAYPLAKMAVEETHRGVLEDKTTKNMFASENIWNSLRHEKTVGVIDEDKEQVYKRIGMILKETLKLNDFLLVESKKNNIAPTIVFNASSIKKSISPTCRALRTKQSVFSDQFKNIC